MAQEKKKLLTSGRLPVDLRGGEEWVGGGVSYEPGVHTVKVVGFEEGEGRKTKNPLYRLICEVIGGPDDGKQIGRNFMVGSNEGLNFLRGFCGQILGETWRESLDDDGQPDLGTLVGAQFDCQVDERTYLDPDTKKEKKGYDLNLTTVENIELPAKKAASRPRPAR